MSNLFAFPRQRSLPGAKLYYRATGTSTPQPTYQDVDLATPHANPVVADADGYFDPIYLDPALPNYRVIHTDGSNVDNDYTLEVLLEPILDDVPSGSIQSSSYRLKSVAPGLIFEETDASTNNKRWRIAVNSELFSIQTGNDAESAWTSVLSIDRSGAVQAGTFSATLTGMVTPVVAVMAYRVALGFVTLTLADDDGIFFGADGTSNSTAMLITGLPVALRPVLPTAHACLLTDNSATAGGWVTVSDSNSITCAIGINANSSGFTSSGTKGLPSTWSVTYPL